MTVKVNLAIMFASHEPWDVSNSIFNLGPSAARLTWENAKEIAKEHKRWLRTPLADAIEATQQ